MRSKSEIAQLLRKLLEAVEDMSEADVDGLLSGNDRLKITVTQSQRAKRKISEGSEMSADELWTIIAELRSCKTREEARQSLHRDPRAALKENLTRMARLMKVHVNKHDRRE